MQRPIESFYIDPDGDWVALLSCGHPQHVRHKPPFTLRPWVTSEKGRAGKFGALLNCVRCDRAELPEGFVLYKRTRTFDEGSVPRGLLENHATKRGVWGKIVIDTGELGYRIDGEDAARRLDASRPGIVVPEQRHRVEPMGPVCFYVEFYRAPVDSLQS